MYNSLQRIRRRFSALPSTQMETSEEVKIMVPLPRKIIALDLDMAKAIAGFKGADETSRSEMESMCSIDSSNTLQKTVVQQQS